MTLYPNPSFDAEKDLTGIGIVNTSASTLSQTRKTLPPSSNIAELVKWMKEPGQERQGGARRRVGSFGHLCGVLFVNEVGAKAGDQIPLSRRRTRRSTIYVAGHADLSCLSAAVVATAGPGQATSRSTASLTRNDTPGCPIQPTMGEAGYEKHGPRVLAYPVCANRYAKAGHRPAEPWHCVTRSPIPRFKEAFDKNAMDLYPADQETPEIATAMLKSEIKRWGDVILRQQDHGAVKAYGSSAPGGGRRR